MSENQIATVVIDCAMKVHQRLGPGLLESAYQECLFYELKSRGIEVTKQHPMPLYYETIKMDVGYRLDLLIENKFIVEIKAVDALNDIHFAQLLTYLKLSGCKLGLLINFNVALLRSGIRRVIHGQL
jgi:GxxExxY protein